MTQPQSGVLAEQSTHAVFLTLVLAPSETASVRSTLSTLPAMTEEVAALGGAPVLSVLAVGSDAWGRLYPAAQPAELTPFKALANGPLQAPSTPADLLLHVRSDRHDLCFELVHRFREALGDAVTLVEQIDGFRYLDSRDLIGFVDGTENPQGEERAEVALVDDDGPFNGGSYIALQRYIHDLNAWEALPLAEQEQAIGRTKVDDIEFDSADKAPSAHTKRAAAKEDGVSLKMLRHSMPYALPDELGLYFIAYTKHARVFDLMLESMVLGGEEGQHDRLLDFTRPVTGARFFAPPRDWLEASGD